MAKTVITNLTDDEKQKLYDQTYDAANEWAQSKGYESIEAMREAYEQQINNAKSNKQTILQERLEGELGKELEELTLLVLRQSIGNFTLPSYFDLISMINDGYVSEGNSKQYIELVPTGNDEYDENEFIPNKFSKQLQEEYTMHFLDPETKTLAKGSYKYKKPLVLVKAKMVYYFLSGKLDVYLMEQINNLYKGFKIFLAVKLFSLLSEMKPAKTINGTAGNLFDALNDDVLPLMEALPQLNAEFNYSDKSKLIRTSEMKDVLFICSNAVASKIRNGIRTQLFNQELFGASGKLLTPENITTLGNKLTMGDSDTAIVDTKTQWIDDNTILVVDMSGIKNWLQLNVTAEQFFAANLADAKYVHVWGHMEMLPWCRCFKYVNANLSTLPNSENAKTRKSK